VLAHDDRHGQLVRGSVEECISYSIPAFRFRGKVVAGFAATKTSLHFDPANGLPARLVRKLLRTRIAELN
jgi:uncharacterized protein YdhG (YjbR/CyaY superfamily)